MLLVSVSGLVTFCSPYPQTKKHLSSLLRNPSFQCYCSQPWRECTAWSSQAWSDSYSSWSTYISESLLFWNKSLNFAVEHCSKGLPYLPVYKSTFHSLKICPKNRPRLIHGSKTEIGKTSGQISLIIVSYGNKHPLLHGTSYGVFSLINLSSWS